MARIKKDIKQIFAFTARNVKVFFKDKGTFLTALISPLILMVLYALFLHRVFSDSVTAMMQGEAIASDIVNGMIASYEVSSVIAVCCVTVAFVANMNMVADKVSGARNDLIVAPVKGHVIVLGYYFATAAVTFCICFVAMAAGMCYIAGMGWAMSAGQVFAAIADVMLATLFGTALSSVVCYFLKSNGAITAVGTIVSSVYGFICGAYYPISQFASGMANTVMCLPGTYCTGLFRTHFLSAYADMMADAGISQTAADSLLGAFDAKYAFFGNAVSVWVMYTVVVCSVLVLIGAFVAINAFSKRNSRY